jgi:hypothetical protein
MLRAHARAFALSVAGVGKSELAYEFARRHRGKYPGGTFFVIADRRNLVFELSRLGQREFHDFPEHLSLEDRAIWTLQSLGTTSTLLVYDNVTSEESMRSWLPPAGMPCHVIMTTLLDRWDAGWLSLELEPLSREMSLDLITAIAGSDLANQYGQQHRSPMVSPCNLSQHLHHCAARRGAEMRRQRHSFSWIKKLRAAFRASISLSHRLRDCWFTRLHGLIHSGFPATN